MVDFSKYQTTLAIPEPSSMIETFRAIGYSIESAVADIIDNSISASAHKVWINFEWAGAETWFSIKDDGCGMNNEELIQALRPGAKNPLDERGNKDLGRFGLGLKTASFSQCRKLSVISKKEESKPVYWTWDLDFVKQTAKWELLKYFPNKKIENEINSVKSGTIVLWTNIDRLVKDFAKEDDRALDKFLEVMKLVKNHLAMVFHRFIENGKVKIYFQDRVIEPWNPFLTSEAATQIFPDEPLYNGRVIIKGYVLPHKSKISEEVFKAAEGPKGWNEQQGFYIYRNDRMLLSGDWLGMYRKEEHYKLARIEINLPNNLDLDWQIDIKKSVARPPLVVRDQLKAYAGKVRAQAVEVYRHKGKTVKPYQGQKFVPLWLDTKRGDKWFYKINREHPLIEKLKKEASTKPDKAFDTLLKFIEETIPVKSIYIREAEEPESQGKPFEGIKHDDIWGLMKTIFDNLKEHGKTSEEAKGVLINLEPFNHYPEYLANIE